MSTNEQNNELSANRDGSGIKPPDQNNPKKPSIYQIIEWMEEVRAEATDGCPVEADGFCEHGQPSWLVKLNLI